MHLVVTGGTGYIGARLCDLAAARHERVTCCSRRRPSTTHVAWQHFDLHSAAPVYLPSDTTALIHLAATTAVANFDVALEISAAQRLVAACQAVGARLIFVSSQAAAPDAPTAYGRSKWLIEQVVLDAGGTVVQPGQVYGGPEQALFGTLVRLIRALPVLPAFLPAPAIQPVHVDDLCMSLLKAANHTDLAGLRLHIAQMAPVPFTTFLQAIARERLQVSRIWLPVPMAAASVASRLMGNRLASATGLTRLTSLFALQSMDTKTSLEKLGMSLREFPTGLQRGPSPGLRALLLEGRGLMAHCLRTPPPPWLCRRYARAVAALHGGHPMHWPIAPHRFPAWLALLDKPSKVLTPDEAALRHRIAIAIAIAEASPQGYRRFNQASAPRGFLHALCRLAHAGSMGILTRLLASALPQHLKPRLGKGRRDGL